TFSFTDKGMFFARRASAYGVTVSYSPTLRMLDEIIFGDPVAAKNAGDGSKEGHVDRAMNVWGSGGAHSSYFKVVDEIIIELFNRPISEQPKGILDMGCGNGAFIQHLFQVIENQTKRGEMLEEHPLILVGADYNEAALEITKQNLIQADIWAKVVFGDIGDPEGLAKKLKNDYRIELNDLLNVRTFLDHNRIWNQPSAPDAQRTSASTGAYASEGKRLNNNLVEESLLEHFKGWQPFVSKFGLLVIELHTVDPNLVSKNLGRTAATAYDATHGYSDQYIVEVEVFKKIAQESGLKSDDRYFRKYPNNELATVTINLFKA
ncbi:MAG: class I SAM-dependent methyltransferase, partial [Flavobacteriales bacterium]|nr:class I SAM-dependent methyltransferase [Flavobacteriales bacterium]